ncbi:MAG TPA: glycosyltransferase family 4 protein [Polyangia bacterium]|nr:glycosyltransferase family 4 protein [Polyangia bacterium]
MRVVYLNPFSQEVSGPDESLLALLTELVPLGVEPHVILPERGPQAPRYEALGATVHVAALAPLRRDFSPAAAGLFPARLLRAAIEVGAIVGRVGADLIHTNMEVLLEGGLAARTLRIPHVLHYRGNTLDEPRLVFDGLAATWTALADHIYCISRATAAVFERRGRGRKVEVLYNPLDVAAFATAVRSDGVRGALGAKGQGPLVGTVGRLHPRKDVETFVRAAALVAARAPDSRFVVVGSAEAPVEFDYRRRIEALIAELGLAGRVALVGARRDVPAVMKALDVFVLTSRHEGFGRVVAEAMAAARPVVVAREGAPPELVEEDRYGLCASPGDASDFAEKILGVLARPEASVAMAASAAERARGFDARAVAENVLGRYRALVAARSQAKK